FSTSPRHGKFTTIDPKGTNSKFAENAGELRRKQTSILFQLRTGHVPLNSHLHRIGEADSPNCPHCDTAGRATIETVKHYITECPAYRKERFCLRQKLGRQTRSLRHLLSDKKCTPHLLRYIGGTKRFEKVFRDVTPADTNNSSSTTRP
ncbi:hypothetical protein F5876DRAFT_53542, partial [Lentinula aff. lateritia]